MIRLPTADPLAGKRRQRSARVNSNDECYLSSYFSFPQSSEIFSPAHRVLSHKRTIVHIQQNDSFRPQCSFRSNSCRNSPIWWIVKLFLLELYPIPVMSAPRNWFSINELRSYLCPSPVLCFVVPWNCSSQSASSITSSSFSSICFRLYWAIHSSSWPP